MAALISTVNCFSTNRTASDNSNAGNASNDSIVPTATPPVVNEKAERAADAPDAVVKDLYKQHDARKSPFFQNKDRALVDKYFDKNLADMIWKDANESDGEVGALGADPLYNAQDMDIKKFAVGQPKITGDKAEVLVSFENYKTKTEMTYLLVKKNNEWKISDINYGESGTLVGNFKEYEKAMSAAENQTGEFEGKYQIGDTTCTVKPVKMAFEVKWAKGSGVEMFFAEGRANDKYVFASDPAKGNANSFSFDDENYDTGIFYRGDGREFPIKRIK